MDSFEKKAGRAYRTALCAAFVVAALAISLTALSGLFIPKDNREAFGMTNQEAHGVLGEPENTIDVLFLGDSEAFCTFSPMQMWDEHGFTSYVCSTSSQKLPYSNTLLHRATENQTPKVVVIETHAIFSSFSISDAMFRAVQNAFPAFEYHDRWKSISMEDATSTPTSTWTHDLKGFRLYKDVKPADATGHMAPSDEVASIPKLNKQYLQEMIGYCKKIGAKPVLVSTPSTVNWNTERHNAITEFAKSAGVDYIDLNMEPTKVPIDWQTETRDAGDHLNFAGATKTSSYIGKYLSKAYSLPDHRSDEAYRPWNEALERYNERVRA